MDDSEKKNNPEKEHLQENFPPNPPPAVPEVKNMLQAFEFMGLQQQVQRGLNFDGLSPEQKDKALDIASEHNKRAFDFQSQRLAAAEKIELKRMESSTINQRTFRLIVVGLIGAGLLLTLAILFFKDQFFTVWLAFITGIAGGFGIDKALKKLQPEQSPNPILEDED